MNRSHYPLMLDLSGREVLVVGGGPVAHGRVRGLLVSGARVTVVTPEVTESLAELVAEGDVVWHARPFAASDVVGAALVFTATGIEAVDGEVAAAARARGIFVNSADDLARCDFHVPAVARRGDITIAVGTGGASPALAARLRDRFAASLGPEWERLAALLGRVRRLARERVGAASERKRVLEAAARDNELLARLARGEKLDAAEVLDRVLDAAAAAEPDEAPGAAGVLDAAAEPGDALPATAEEPAGDAGATRAHVALVGAGPGAPDLLTARAYDRIRSADVIVYDDLVDRRTLAEAPVHAELVYAGKRGWRECPNRPGPELLVQRALEARGKRVVRLKGGDPNVFGRSTEEIAALEQAGIDYELVPGVTAALAAAASAHIPLTERRVAGSVTLATGVSLGASARAGAEGAAAGETGAAAAELAPEEPTAADIASLVRTGSTVVVYMGLRVLPEIVEALTGAGVPETLPVAVVGSASLPSEVVVKGTLSDIAVRVADTGVPSPAVVILGEVAR